MILDVAERTAELSEICGRFHVARLDLYGKAATADYLTEKDSLTLLVEFQSLPISDYFDSYFGLLESLQRLFCLPVKLLTANAMATNPYSRPVDEAAKLKVYGD